MKMHLSRAWITPILIIDALVPFYSTLIIFCYLLLNPLYLRIYRNFQEENIHEIDQADFLSDTEYKVAKTQIFDSKDEENQLFDSFQLQPYLDIIYSNDIDKKISVCIKLANFHTQESIYILKNALQDINYEVRYMANNSLNKIEQSFMSEIDILSENILKFPQDPELYKLRGNNYLKLHNIGLLDNFLAHSFLEKALDDFRYVIQNKPDEYTIYLKIAYIYLKLKLYNELDLLVEKSSALPLDSEDRSKLQFYRLESLFNQKKFPQLIEASKNIDLSSVSHTKIKDPTLYWREL